MHQGGDEIGGGWFFRRWRRGNALHRWSGKAQSRRAPVSLLAIGEVLILRKELRQFLTQEFVLLAQCRLRAVLGDHDYRRSAEQDSGNGKLDFGHAHALLFEIGPDKFTSLIGHLPYEN